MKQIVGYGNTLRCRRTSLRQAVVLALLMAAAGLSHAQATRPAQDFDIPAGSLVDALDRFGEQSGLQVTYDLALLKNKRAPAVKGKLSPDAALKQLLQGAGLDSGYLNEKTIIIKKVDKPSSLSSQLPSTKTISGSSAEEPRDMAAVTITGTRIRGGNNPSPTITIGSERIAEEGFTDLGDVVRSIPQNFSGGQSPGVAGGAANTGNNYNSTGGTGVNLRGLGPDATLTLLNGRRMSYGGTAQAVDISAIPVEAVERIEVVPDGASAVYGSDAVGGVVNVILKPDFDGVTVDTRYGGATDGGLITREYTVTGGANWSTGGLIATWRKASNDPIYSDQRDYTNDVYRKTTLWQGNDLRSGLFSLHQSLGDSIELHLDGLRTERNILTDVSYSGYYNRYTPQTKTTLLSPSIEWQLFNDWMLTMSASIGKENTSSYQQVIRNGLISTTNIGAYTNKSLIYEVGAEGFLFTLPGGDARIATGVGYKYNSFLSLGISSNRINADGEESSRFAYAELNFPLIGQNQNIAGISRLALTGAIREEDYNSYGHVSTPKIGLIYAPNSDFTLKASWGRSFKTPTLYQRFYRHSVYYYPATAFGSTSYGDDATVLYRSGGNPDLKPERAQTWSASLAFHPEALEGLEAELTWFDIDYTNRIVQPITNASQVLKSSQYDQFIDYSPTTEEQARVIEGSDSFENYASTSYNSSNVVAIIDNRYINVARQNIKGIDLSGSYRFDLGFGRMTIRGSFSWLESEQATMSTSGYTELAGTLFHPAKISGRMGTVWNAGGFTASFFGNYKSGVKNTTIVNKGGSFTTFDSTLSYETGEQESVFANMMFEFSMQNILNRAPPLYKVSSLAYVPYDSTNYSGVGRFLSVSISKHW